MEDHERRDFSPLLDDLLGPGAPVTPEVRIGRNDAGAPLPECVRCGRPGTMYLRAVWLSTRAVLDGDVDVDSHINVNSCGSCAGSVAGMILINWDPRYWGESVNLD
ncbi:hypothetical protein JK358_17855 [Nocardia sp. 2]|uniref:Uncharacterized protein n=1 Tax=Nocardia acididurans TaxID=2802282 RepID=A0ABS1M7J3_9NOCA|nr:hypothetical protein [Nocardia acididurans]MBL1076266.1 hypothetical protein [Nocardia acididurans]